MTSLKVADFDTSKDVNLLNKQKKQSKTAKKSYSNYLFYRINIRVLNSCFKKLEK